MRERSERRGGTWPGGAAAGTARVIRSGCWGNTAGYCRSAIRFSIGPDPVCFTYSIRLALPADLCQARHACTRAQ